MGEGLMQSDLLQIAGSFFILSGYWLMAKSVKRASAALVVGCAIWTYWSMIISPPALWMAALEVILGAMSARTFYLNRHKL